MILNYIPEEDPRSKYIAQLSRVFYLVDYYYEFKASFCPTCCWAFRGYCLRCLSHSAETLFAPHFSPPVQASSIPDTSLPYLPASTPVSRHVQTAEDDVADRSSDSDHDSDNPDAPDSMDTDSRSTLTSAASPIDPDP